MDDEEEEGGGCADEGGRGGEEKCRGREVSNRRGRKKRCEEKLVILQ